MVTIVCVYISFSGWRKTQIYFIIFQDNDASVASYGPVSSVVDRMLEPFNQLQFCPRQQAVDYFVNVIEFPQNP